MMLRNKFTAACNLTRQSIPAQNSLTHSIYHNQSPHSFTTKMDAFSDCGQPISETDLEAASSSSSSPSLKRKTNSTTTTTLRLSASSRRRLPSLGDSQSSTINGDLQIRSSRVLRSQTATKSSPRPGPASSRVTVKVRSPVVKFGGQIVYCTTFSEVEKATAELLKFMEAKQDNMDPVALGFDIEWRPTFGRGVLRKAALMQICGNTSCCYVFHIIHSGIPPILQTLLEDPKYVKVGVCIAGDADKISNDYNIRIKSLEDLSWLANQKLDGFPRSSSLASLTEMLTCKELEKPNKIRLGNWEVNPLSGDQLLYAATDAFISWHLYEILKSLPDLPKQQNKENVDGLQS